MSAYYDRPFPVDKWIIATGLTDKQKEIFTKTMPKKGVTFMPWPSLFYKDEILSYTHLGYAEYIKPYPFFLDINSLAIRAAQSLLRKYNQNSQLSGMPLYHRQVNNKIENDEDYTRVMNEILTLNDEITLSQIFNLAENKDHTFVSYDAHKPTIQKIATKIITIGNGNSFDIDLTDKPQKDLIVAISAAFKE